jgi:hypothetical protein
MEGPYTSVSSSPTTLFGATDFIAAERLTNRKRHKTSTITKCVKSTFLKLNLKRKWYIKPCYVGAKTDKSLHSR